ncbi:MAG: ECF transporter S component [Flavobacteriaceae bacterium]|jgi:hypothetical protein|nr:ECF transporter S component [Flavobacteriaceae bacterium]
MTSKTRLIYGTSLLGDIMINILGVLIGIILMALSFVYKASMIDNLANSGDSINFAYYIIGMFIFGYVISFLLLRKIFCGKWEISINDQTLRTKLKNDSKVVPINSIKRIEITGNSVLRNITITTSQGKIRMRFGFYIEKFQKGYRRALMKEVNDFMNDLDEVLLNHNFVKNLKKKSSGLNEVKSLIYYKQ